MTDYNQEQWTVTEGADVVGSDGDKVGEVVNAYPDYIVVKKGFFFPSDYYVPSSAIANVDEGHVYLNVTKEEAMNQDPSWETEPVGSTTTGYDDTAAATTGAGYTADTDATTSTTATGLGGYTADVDDRETVTTASTDLDRDTTTTRNVDDDNVRVSLAEEELTATKRQVDLGAVEVTKNVVSEEQTLEVPVTEERVNVERRVVDRAVGTDDNVFEEGTIEVPISGEEVELRKEARVTEEVRIDKDQVQSTERVSGTVRHEEVQIDDTTNTTGRTTGTTRGSEQVQVTETVTDSSGGSSSGDDRGLLDKAADAVSGDDSGNRDNRNRGGGNPI
ncbi:MAG: DUF2382 domain-containing protein [Chloroflexota bacterium]|nr:DUF2382 domain-containing protein [Chloroflexota bacterium]